MPFYLGQRLLVLMRPEGISTGDCSIHQAASEPVLLKPQLPQPPCWEDAGALACGIDLGEK